MGMRKTAYLTIDDGPSVDWEGKLDSLAAHGIPAVWFCEGGALAARPEFAPKAIALRHVVANHSYNHPHFSDTAISECKDEIRRTDDLIDQCYAETGVPRLARFFRFPYGDKGAPEHPRVPGLYQGESARRKAALQAFLRDLGYWQPAFPGITYRYYRRAGLLADADWYWTFDCGEHVMADETPPDPRECLAAVFERMERDEPERGYGLNCPDTEDIVLIHDHPETTEMFPRIIERMLSRGIRFRAAPRRAFGGLW
jgi:peptidoglycan/xylan/chitin deacetylase (PgdA/CDA1 family)